MKRVENPDNAYNELYPETPDAAYNDYAEVVTKKRQRKKRNKLPISKPGGRYYGDFTKPTNNEIRRRILNIDHDMHRYAAMYQYLIAGRVIETCGKYAPTGLSASEHEIEIEDKWVRAALFISETAKREGRLRPILLPLEKESFAEPVLRYFQKYDDDEKPFIQHMRTQQRCVEKSFEGVMYPYADYSNGIEKVERGWRHFNTHCFRHARAQELQNEYGFDAIDLSLYAGWTQSTADALMPPVLQKYLYFPLRSIRDQRPKLLNMALRYFTKLLRPRTTRRTRLVYRIKEVDSVK